MSNLFTRNRVIGLIFAVLIAASDQFTKWLVAGPLGLTEQYDKMDLLPFFDLNRVHNYGISLGMFQATNMEMRWILVGVTALIALVVAVWMMREKLLGDILGLSLILGGAVGNIWDRATIGYVLDFADFHIGDFRPFLVFNIADAAITIGVVIILARSLFMRDEETNETDAVDKTTTVPSEN